MSETSGKKGRLDNLPSAPRLTGKEAAAHSANVRRLRIALPTIGAVLVGVFLANTRGEGPADVFLDQFKDLEAATEELRMARPHFSGVDADGRPFDITADAATQAAGDSKRIGLEGPRAVSGANGDDRSILSAIRGEFDSNSKTLVLTEDVTFERRVGADDYVMKTPSATFLIDEDKVTSDAGVRGQGPRGATLEADKMTANNEDKRVVFEGNVKVRIYPSREEGDCLPRFGAPVGERDPGENCKRSAGEDGKVSPEPTIRENR
ncbi:MAG: LPS export ABC transporter periplasmic protein LptC [Alphaproteobacteria bacterium]|nr:LPS export ABC transporter periplasmic protein LptC [Alphaproteobacteria bacterium]